jgi:endonuclease IV
MPLHHREDFEIIRDVFDLIRNEYIKYGEYSENWKRELAREIKQVIELLEDRTVKEESILRNINRMLAYYEQSGAQARSGQRYLKYLEIILQEKFDAAFALATFKGEVGGIAQRFQTLEEARLYVEDIEVLKIYFDPHTKLFVVLRFDSEMPGSQYEY